MTLDTTTERRLQGQFSERICGLIVDVPVPQVVVQDVANAIDFLQFQVRAISNEIQEKYSGKGVFD